MQGQIRVRHHGDLARIEVEDNEVHKLFKNPTKQFIYDEFQKLGFKFITVDLLGYQKGSNNITLKS